MDLFVQLCFLCAYLVLKKYLFWFRNNMKHKEDLLQIDAQLVSIIILNRQINYIDWIVVSYLKDIWLCFFIGFIGRSLYELT